MELKTASLRVVFNPAHGRISFFAGKDKRPLLLNAGYFFNFGTRAGGVTSFRPDLSNCAINVEHNRHAINIRCVPRRKSIPEFILHAMISPDGKGVEIKTEIRNSSGAEITLESFTVLETDCIKEGALFPGRSPHEFVFFGYRSAPYDMLPEWILPEFAQHGKYGFFGDAVSAIADAAKRDALIFGFVSYRKWWSKTSLRMRQIGFGFQRLRSVCHCDGTALPAGQTACSETLRIAYAANVSKGLENWAERTAVLAGCKKDFKMPTGWSTWDYYHGDINEKNILENVKFLASNRDRFPVEYIQIDAGFTKIYGDWLDWDKKSFPHGPKWLVDQIKSYGFKAGIWFIPTMASDKSNLFRKHPDWFLRKKDGSLVYRHHTSGLAGSRFCHFLDASVPEVRKWIEDLGRAFVKDIGFEYIKTDGATNYALSAGFPKNRSATLFSAFRSVMTALRKGAGNETFLLHGGFVPSTAGTIDGNRVGYDIAARWAQAVPEPYENKIEASRPFMTRILANVFNAWFVNDRLWKNDPDYLLAREHGGSAHNFTVDEAKLWATASALCSGPLMLGDRMKTLPESRLKILEAVFPPVKCRLQPLDFCINRIPHLIAADFPDGGVPRKVLAFFNHTEAEQEFSADLKELGLKGKVHAREFWSGNYTLNSGKTFCSGKMKPHTVRIFALRAIKNHPQIVGSDMHIFQGAGLLTERWNAKDKTLEIKVAPGMKRNCKVIVWIPAKYRANIKSKPVREGSFAEIALSSKEQNIMINFKTG